MPCSWTCTCATSQPYGSASASMSQVALAWQGVTERIDNAGGLVDCCTNTGVQENLQAYLDRPAIFGRDDRGGAMALWFAVEMEQLARTPRR